VSINPESRIVNHVADGRFHDRSVITQPQSASGIASWCPPLHVAAGGTSVAPRSRWNSEGGFMYWIFVAITCVVAFGWVKIRRQRKGASGSQAR
jgi:hypothetical protein